MNATIFRKKSLEQLASPERLDELMQITSPRLWIALACVGVLLAFALLWGIVGRIPTTVHGQGILLRNGGLFVVSSLGAGQVQEIDVKVGDVVEAGQVVARISLPELAQQLQNAKANFAELKADTARRLKGDVHETELNQQALTQQEQNLQQGITNLQAQTDWLKQQISNQEKLLAEGLITRQTLVATTQQLSAVEARIDDTHAQVNGLMLQSLQLENDRRNRAAQAELALNQAQRSLAQLTLSYEQGSNVVAPYHGRVIEIMGRNEDLVQQGSPLINLELVGQQLTALIYVPAQDGKNVRPGMQIQISPSTVKKERYGVLLGQVESISEFPSTTQAMSTLLKNDTLVALLSSQGAQFAVQAKLDLNPGTESGFAWSSASGPPVKINAGTLCQADVVVEEQAPITMVVPYLRKQLGL